MNTPNFHRAYPKTRMRRLRQYKWSRNLFSEHSLSPSDLILPVFVIEGENQSIQIPSMPGVKRLSIDLLLEKAKLVADLGIPVIAMFPVIDKSKRTENAAESINENNLICRAIREVKKNVPNIGIMCDVALDPFTSHGHDGLIINNKIANDETIKILTQQAINQSNSGCDIIAPSDMMDGRVNAIRNSLDNSNHSEVIIMSYAAKYASYFYGPFRDALNTKTLLKQDKLTYQMDPSNVNEALHEVALDISEGADMILIKPGMPYLDILFRVKEAFKMPTFAYQVSGEYLMLSEYIKFNEDNKIQIITESLLSFKRAGADGIVTYFAEDLAKNLI